MGACASFPKGLAEAKEAPPPEKPKEEVDYALISYGIKVNNKGKEEDEKTRGTFLKEEIMEETKTTQTEEEMTLKTEEAVKSNPTISEALSESLLLKSDGKIESERKQAAEHSEPD